MVYGQELCDNATKATFGLSSLRGYVFTSAKSLLLGEFQYLLIPGGPGLNLVPLFSICSGSGSTPFLVLLTPAGTPYLART